MCKQNNKIFKCLKISLFFFFFMLYLIYVSGINYSFIKAVSLALQQHGVIQFVSFCLAVLILGSAIVLLTMSLVILPIWLVYKTIKFIKEKSIKVKNKSMFCAGIVFVLIGVFLLII